MTKCEKEAAIEVENVRETEKMSNDLHGGRRIKRNQFMLSKRKEKSFGGLYLQRYIRKLGQLREQKQEGSPDAIRLTELLGFSRMSDFEDENSPNDLSGNELCVNITKYSAFWLVLASKFEGLLEELQFVEELSREKIEGRRWESHLISGTEETEENERGQERRAKDDAILIIERDIFIQWF